MKVITCEQGSTEWHRARAGAITASNFNLVRDRLKSGPNKGGLKKDALDYAFRLAVERISGEPLDEGGAFETFAMRRGHELEPEARSLHALRYGLDIDRAGIVLADDARFGASADGLIGGDGGSEYKCFVNPEKIRSIVIDGDIDDYLPQVQGCLWLTGRSWWHFGLYCPALARVGRELTIYPVERDDDYIEALEKDMVAFDRVVEEYCARLSERGAENESAAQVAGIFGG